MLEQSDNRLIVLRRPVGEQYDKQCEFTRENNNCSVVGVAASALQSLGAVTADVEAHHNHTTCIRSEPQQLPTVLALLVLVGSRAPTVSSSCHSFA